MSTKMEPVIRCDICQKKREVKRVSVTIHDCDGEEDSPITTTSEKDACDKCVTRLNKFILRGMNPPPERKAK